MKREVSHQSDLTDYSEDGRLSEHSDGKRYEWAKMINLSKKLGRPLTMDEAEEFLVAQGSGNHHPEQKDWNYPGARG